MGGVGKVFKKAVGGIFNAARSAVGSIAGAFGAAPNMPEVPEIKQNAIQVDTPDQKAEKGDEGNAEARKKKAQRSGKGSLSIAKSGGTGVNV